MEEEFDVIKVALEKIVGVKLVAEDTSDVLSDEKNQFCKLVAHLDKLFQQEQKLYVDYGIDISSIVQPYWDMLEELFDFAFDESITEIIWFYVYDRKNQNGKVIGWEDEDGTEYKFETPSDLYEFIQHKFGI